MKFKEIFTLTRPDTSVPFNPESSVFHVQSESDWTTAAIKQHFTENYINTSKCELVTDAVSLSDDGLTLTYTTIFLTEEAISDLYTDSLIQADLDIRLAHWETNNIEMNTDLFPIIE
jgi:hypothetical protein